MSLIYIWMKKCVKICDRLFKMYSFVFEKGCQTGPMISMGLLFKEKGFGFKDLVVFI